MLDFNVSEMMVVAVVALLVIGPKDLPKAMRFVGQWVGKARGVARQFRSGFDAMVREAELAEMEKKWSEENARIMREHPPEPPQPALPAPENAEVAGEDPNIPVAPDDGDRPPVTVAKPDIRPEPETHASEAVASSVNPPTVEAAGTSRAAHDEPSADGKAPS